MRTTSSGDGNAMYFIQKSFPRRSIAIAWGSSFRMSLNAGRWVLQGFIVGLVLVVVDAQAQTSALELSSLDGSNGFVIHGVDVLDNSGGHVSSAGDVNGDGLDDLIIGARLAGPDGRKTGVSYVVFGSSQGFSTPFELSTLNGNNGFAIHGVAADDLSGDSVSGAGDVNGDGLDDIIISAVRASANSLTKGTSYVVFGSNQGFTTPFKLSALNGDNGFAITGVGNPAYHASSAGDINGDGLDDVVVSGNYRNPNGLYSTIASYVVFGSRQGFSTPFELPNLNGRNGFAIYGFNDINVSSVIASAAGDVNGDGLDDLIIGEHGGPPNGQISGAAYVVFGSNQGFAETLELSTLNGNNGFVIKFLRASDFAGEAASAAGDVNGDGLDDIIVGARFANPNGPESGASYVLFGSNQGFGASFELRNLNGDNGFAIYGVEALDVSGRSVSAAGDFNGDGVDDLIIGAPRADPNTRSSGASYVVFGSNRGFSTPLELSALSGNNGFVINGIKKYDFSGTSVSDAGDVNGDGLDDLIIGATDADPNGRSSGASYVVFGGIVPENVPVNCGRPSIDSETGSAVYVWQDCPGGVGNGQWHLRATSNNFMQVIRYDGAVRSDAPITTRSVQYENSDSLNATPTSFAFVMRMLYRGIDGVDFATTPSAELCLDLSRNTDDAPIRLGSSRKIVSETGVLVDLKTGEACTFNPASQ